MGNQIGVTRRSFAKGLSAVGLTAFTNPAASLARADAHWGGWPQFRGDAALSGVSGSTMTATPKEIWTWEAGEPIESSAAIADNTVYVGSGAGELVALDFQTGKVKWKYLTTKDGIGESSPAVADGTVYIGDMAGTFHAVNAATGQKKWTFKSGSEIKSSPVITENKILIGSYDGILSCLNAATGAVLWKLVTDGPVHATPSVVNGVTFVSGCDAFFHAIRVADGREQFKVALPGQAGSSPAIMGQFAYFGLYENEVISVNLQTRRIGWHYQHPKRQFPYYSSPAVSGGKVVIGGRDKMVHCINATNGRALWTYATKARVESSPGIAEGRVYVGSNDGRLYVLELATGKLLSEFVAGAAISASPALALGRVIVGTHDGKLFCLG
ncbi:MAG: PQQ-binding-like beta-propeller repeat protein [Blastocatellia bacterium]